MANLSFFQCCSLLLKLLGFSAFTKKQTIAIDKIARDQNRPAIMHKIKKTAILLWYDCQYLRKFASMAILLFQRKSKIKSTKFKKERRNGVLGKENFNFDTGIKS